MRLSAAAVSPATMTAAPSPSADLRRRRRILEARADETTTTTAAAAASESSVGSSAASAASTTRPAADGPHRGTDCFTTSTVDTTTCTLYTSDGRVRTSACSPTRVAQSECAPGLLCTVDAAANDVCMRRHDGLDTAGLVLALVFGALVAVGLGLIAFLCCRDRRRQRRLAARAEALALARAHTTRKRKQEQLRRLDPADDADDGPAAAAPLMPHAADDAAHNPFQDRPRSES